MKELKNTNNVTSKEKIKMTNTIISDISVIIYSKKMENDLSNHNIIEKRAEILEELGIYSEPSGTDDFWLFYENYSYPKEEHDRIKAIVDKYSSERYSDEQVHIVMDCLYP